MILNDTLNDREIESTLEEGKCMTISANSADLFFKMYIKNTYSNVYGSIVREICSNSYDSHIQANTTSPIVIRKGKDEHTGMPYISFIDFGVGMSPEIMDSVYCVFLTSTKTDTNNQIGAYGMGSKVPLAYNRQLSYGSTESDNSFYVITISEGIKYTYLVYEGKKSPMLSLLHTEECTEHNGTEVRVPILSRDEYKFENEILKQLYYFDSIVFENFDNEKISNDYQILRANTFLYRGSEYSPYIHICLGKVAYPINYDVLGLDSSDYQFPVAINFEIGDINVVTSREAIDYSDSTIKMIKKRLKEAKEELLEMLTRQYDNVVTLADYFKFKRNFNKLNLIEGKIIVFNKIEADYIKLKNFIYKDIKKIPTSKTLFDIQYRSVEYSNNKRKSRYYDKEFDGDYFKLTNKNKYAYLWDGSEISTKRNTKLNYLKYISDNFYLITKKRIIDEIIKIQFDLKYSDLATLDIHGKVITYSPIYDTILDILNDYSKIIESNIENYDDIVISEDYLSTIKKTRNYIKGNMVINIVKPNTDAVRETIELKDLAEFKGTIVYGNPDEIYTLKTASQAFGYLFKSEPVIQMNYDKTFTSKTFSSKDHKKVLFIYVAKGNIKKLLNLNDVVHVNEMYNRFFFRKEKEVLLGRYLNTLHEKLYNLNSFYLSDNLNLIYPKLGSYVKSIKKLLTDNVNLTRKDNFNYNYNKWFDFSLFEKSVEYLSYKKYERMLENLNYAMELNQDILSCFNVHSLNERPLLVELLKTNLVSEK